LLQFIHADLASEFLLPITSIIIRNLLKFEIFFGVMKLEQLHSGSTSHVVSIIMSLLPAGL
jgi:hypothetical protein